MTDEPKWEKEADLCRDFTEWATKKGWVVYAECGGWDLLLVRPEDGFQIGVEAKLSLNAKVLCQVLESDDEYTGGPDCHAVLVPRIATVNGLSMISRRLNIVVIEGVWETERERWNTARGDFDKTYKASFRPDLPDRKNYRSYEYGRYDGCWPERCPDQRLTLPDYVPDVTGGHSAPVQLTDWKIRAIKIMIVIEKLGAVTRADFKALKIDYKRWTQFWLKSDGSGGWIPDERYSMPDFKAQHPVNYEQIKADWDTWSRDLPARLVA